MRTISKALKEGMKRGSAKPAGKAEVKLKDGTVFTFTLADLWEYRIDNGTSGTGSFDIGQAVIGMLKLQFENTDDRYTGYDFTDAEVTAWIGGTLNPGAENETTELVQCGIFYADEKKMSDSSITLNCLDRMAWLDTPYSGVSTQYPATIQAIVQDICNYCGIVLATAEIDFGDFVVQERPDDDALNCRDMVHYAAEICGCYARCSPEGQLELKWYDTKPLESGTYHTIDALKVFKPELEDIQITGIQVTVEKEDDRENPEVILAGTAGYVLEITGNPLIAEGQTETVAAHLYEKMAGMTFRPLEVTGIVDCSIEAGDAICVIDRKGNEYQSWATNVSYAPGSACRITCGAESPGEKNASRYSETTKAVTQLKKKLRLERTERETALAALAERLQNSSGLFCTKVAMPNGSTVYYMHDKPLLEDSGIIWKLTAEAIGISTDGGKTYPYGLDVSGTAILKRVYTIGLNASYINSGTFTAKDADGNIVFLVDVDTGRVQIDASSITMHSESLEEHLDGLQTAIDKSYTDATQTASEIITEAVKEYVKTNDLETLKQQLSTQLTQTAESIEMTFNQVTQRIQDLADDTSGEFSELKSYIRFEDGNIILGKDDNPLILTLKNNRISFTSSGQEVAYFSDNRMYISNATITTSADIVGLKITMDDDGIFIDW